MDNQESASKFKRDCERTASYKPGLINHARDCRSMLWSLEDAITAANVFDTRRLGDEFERIGRNLARQIERVREENQAAIAAKDAASGGSADAT